MKSKTYKIGVVIPFYNRSQSIVRAVESVLKQDFGGAQGIRSVLKIVVVDDGSAAGESKILDRLALEYPDVSVYSLPENKGATFARNMGKSLLPGMDWYCFLDSDEEWKPNFISESIQNIHEGAEWICGGFETKNRFGGSDVYIPPSEVVSVPEFLFKENGHLKTSCMLLSAKALSKVEWDNGLRRFQDLDFSLRLSLVGFEPVPIRKSLVVSYTNQENRISNMPAADLAVSWIESYAGKIRHEYIQAFKDRRMPSLLAQESRFYDSVKYIFSSKTIKKKQKVAALRGVAVFSCVMAVKKIMNSFGLLSQ